MRKENENRASTLIRWCVSPAFSKPSDSQAVDCGYREESNHFYALSWLEVIFWFRQSLNNKFFDPSACDGTDRSPSSRASWQEINREECRKNANLLQRARHDRGDLS